MSLTCVGLQGELPTLGRAPHPASIQQDPVQGSPTPVSKAWKRPITPKPVQTSWDTFPSASHHFFYNPKPTKLSWKRKEKKFSLTSCTALPQQSPLRPTKKEDKLSMFICQFYFPPICFSLVCKPRNGERRWDADTFFSAAASELVLLSSRLTVVCDPHNDQTCTAPW